MKTNAESRQALWVRARRAAGRCACGRPATRGLRCAACYARETAARRARLGFAPWRPGRPGRPPTHP